MFMESLGRKIATVPLFLVVPVFGFFIKSWVMTK